MTEDTPATNPIPRAIVQPTPRHTWAWVLPILALGLSVFLVVQAAGGRGPLITVHADEGHGIKAGDALRYRGIDVGVVERVELSRGLERVVLALRLDPDAESLARSGSRFWIVRPQLTLDSLEGLETVVGARYLAVLPGPAGGGRQSEFEALESQPAVQLRDPGALEIVLEAPERYGLVAGAPVTYRQIAIGTVLSTGLSSDATSVEVRLYIRPEYSQLIREGTRFWETGGVEVTVTLTGGFQLDLGSLRNLLVGGVALATPPNAGDVVLTGHRFQLHAEPQKEWIEWSPPLPVGASDLPDGQRPPRLLRGTLSWKQGRIFKRKRSRQGWVLPVDGGLLGPAALLIPDEDAIDGTTVLEVGGETFPIGAQPAWHERGLARVAVTLSEAVEWDLTAARELVADGEDCLVFGDPASPPRALDDTRLTDSSRGWEVDGAIGFEESWNGACVVAREDGMLVGILLVDDQGTRVVPVPQPVD